MWQSRNNERTTASLERAVWCCTCRPAAGRRGSSSLGLGSQCPSPVLDHTHTVSIITGSDVEGGQSCWLCSLTDGADLRVAGCVGLWFLLLLLFFSTALLHTPHRHLAVLFPLFLFWKADCFWHEVRRWQSLWSTTKGRGGASWLGSQWTCSCDQSTCSTSRWPEGMRTSTDNWRVNEQIDVVSTSRRVGAARHTLGADGRHPTVDKHRRQFPQICQRETPPGSVPLRTKGSCQKSREVNAPSVSALLLSCFTNLAVLFWLSRGETRGGEDQLGSVTQRCHRLVPLTCLRWSTLRGSFCSVSRMSCSSGVLLVVLE